MTFDDDLHAIRRLDELYLTWKRTGRMADWFAYETARREADRRLRMATEERETA